MRNWRRAIVVFCAAFTLTLMDAQEYKTAIGVRAGTGTGFTVRHFITSVSALEGIMQFQYKGFEITGLYQIHNPKAFQVDRLNWYYGAGGHIGSYNSNHRSYKEEPDKTYMTLGVDGILGIEYNFAEVPINISADWKPNIDLIRYSRFYGDSGALSVRYYF